MLRIKKEVNECHGDYEFFRNLYEGKHHEIFPRAKHLIETGELSVMLENGEELARQISTPYVMVNVSKMIVDIPTLFISRSLGGLKTNYPINVEEAEEDFDTDKAHLEIDEEEEVFDIQQETLDQIAEDSRLYQQHSMNLKQWQIDGGIVLVPEQNGDNIKLTFKERNTYYELDDGITYQLRYFKKIDDVEYIHIHQETELPDGLEIKHMVSVVNEFDDNTGNDEEVQEIDDPEVFEKVSGIKYEDRDMFIKDRKRKFFEYLPYEPTFMNKYGNSVLAGLGNKQDEINWTLTRTAQTFERNGKPRISVSKEVMDRLQEISLERYGKENQIDHRDLEVTEINERGESLQIHQIDITKIGDITYVKDIIKMMLMETQTSEKAVDFFSNASSVGTQSGIAKFYDLFLSIMKSEKMRDEYVKFLQRGIENCLWLLNQVNKDIKVEKPIVIQAEMLPVTSKEVKEENNTSYIAGTQSLEQTIRNNNPDKSEEWIMNELETIEESRVSQDSFSLFKGNQTATNFNDNRPLGDVQPTEPTDDIDEE